MIKVTANLERALLVKARVAKAYCCFHLILGYM